MTGYQEVLTDPSYAGQVVAMTYPHVGNYGINEQDGESLAIRVEGFILREYHPMPSNWRSTRSLGEYLQAAGVLGVTGVDTRALPPSAHPGGHDRPDVHRGPEPESLVERAQKAPGLDGRDLVKAVTTAKPYVWVPDEQGGTTRTPTGGHRGLVPQDRRPARAAMGLWQSNSTTSAPWPGGGPMCWCCPPPPLRNRCWPTTRRHLPVQRTGRPV